MVVYMFLMSLKLFVSLSVFVCWCRFDSCLLGILWW